MRNQLMSLALSVLALTVAAPAAHAQSASARRPSVALLDFDFGSIQPWWSGNVDLRGVSDKEYLDDFGELFLKKKQET